MASISIAVRFHGLKKFASLYRADLRFSANGPLRQSMQQWVSIYQEFLYNRYVQFSRGGGNWKPLAPSTIAKKGNAIILIDTKFLIKHFNPSFRKPKQIAVNIPFGVRVNLPKITHPKANTTLEELVHWHQTGAGRLPVRKLIVPPTGEVNRQMRNVTSQALRLMGAKLKS